MADDRVERLRPAVGEAGHALNRAGQHAGDGADCVDVAAMTFFTACSGVSTSETTPGRHSLEQSYLRLR